MKVASFDPTYNVRILLPWLGPDTAHWLGVFCCLFICKAVDDLAGGRVHHFDAAINESNTDISTVLGVAQAENLTTTFN